MAEGFMNATAEQSIPQVYLRQTWVLLEQTLNALILRISSI